MYTIDIDGANTHRTMWENFLVRRDIYRLAEHLNNDQQIDAVNVILVEYNTKFCARDHFIRVLEFQSQEDFVFFKLKYS